MGIYCICDYFKRILRVGKQKEVLIPFFLVYNPILS